MAISSAMYAAVTGLSALGTGMQTISNNIANVNTVGFKAGRTNYEDLISQNYYSGGSGRVNQRGCGVKVSSIQSMFTQGAFMSSAQDTDMAIAGEGFFAVRNTVRNEVMYTRAGNFTLNKDGYIEDPSGNILQGWQMSIPKPGMDPVRIGAPTDIKITVLNAPPVETSQMKVVVNLNSDMKTSYDYDEYPMADEIAERWAAASAAPVREPAEKSVWDPAPSGADVPVTSAAGAVVASNNSNYNKLFIDEYNKLYNPSPALTSITGPPPMTIVYPPATPNRNNAEMTLDEYNNLVTTANDAIKSEAFMAGEVAYNNAKEAKYNSVKEAIKKALPSWEAEGNGFAGAWNAQKTPYIDVSDGKIHEEPMIIYDSLGSEHKLMVYYQKNPHMENVWDYIITCDPLEDARKDSNTPPQLLLSDSASFSGLIQKGKITFSADGDDRHGGLIKDIEAQNINLDETRMATADVNKSASNPTSPSMQNAVIGGYYTGLPSINQSTYQYEVSKKEYQIIYGAPSGIDLTDKDQVAGKLDDYVNGLPVTWDKYVNQAPQTEGLIWFDPANPDDFGFIPISDPNNTGPYNFGDGLTITFDPDIKPMKLGPTPGTDALQVDATSELVVWENIDPNENGYFDFDVAFVQSASMALHPPYPSGMPTVIQNVAFDMGAKRNLSGGDPKWILDKQSTTQYASKYSTVFAGQDGYPAGSLQRISVGEDGVITGVYTNGRQQALYQVGLTRFLNPWGLSKEGDNLFSETRYSGQGAMNEPGYGGTGTILGNFLEQSNVDIADEIVNMILTQRGFQANSKTVTTTDTMLAEVIEMKR